LSKAVYHARQQMTMKKETMLPTIKNLSLSTVCLCIWQVFGLVSHSYDYRSRSVLSTADSGLQLIFLFLV
jgi:hypothetical protein